VGRPLARVPRPLTRLESRGVRMQALAVMVDVEARVAELVATRRPMLTELVRLTARPSTATAGTGPGRTGAPGRLDSAMVGLLLHDQVVGPWHAYRSPSG
jgi:hypothetical protein